MISKKALMITFHCCPNYGAVLQALGLYEYLKKLFNHIEVLDYQPTTLMDEYKYINTYSIASVVMSLVALPDFFVKRRKFLKFITKNFNMTPLYKNAESIECTDATHCFVGSDQIWNPEITKGFDPVYFGKIPSQSEMKVISYAASIGTEDMSSENLKQLKSDIKKINAISVREMTAKKVIEKITDKKVEIVLDPTLLVGVEVFRRFVKPLNLGEKYLFVYTLNASPNKEIRPLAYKVAEKLSLKVIEINGNRRGLKNPKHKVLYNAGPDEFLSMLANAEYVVTDSFHGTAFSLLFHRQFITLPHKTRGGRMVNLLSLVGLENRLTANPSDETIEEKISWKAVDLKLTENRKISEHFLAQI